MVNIFENIPLILTTNYQENTRKPQTTKDVIYEQIIADLIDAKSKLLKDYSSSGIYRIRPNKNAAIALLARTYLYKQQWAEAEIEANEIIDNTSLYALEADLNNVFLLESREVIWQLQSILSGWGVFDARFLAFTSKPTNVALTTDLLESFEDNDSRKEKWVKTITSGGETNSHVFKYKVKSTSTPTEYLSVFRLAEIYLIRAEARIQLNKVSEGIADLNVIRGRSRNGVTGSLPDLDETISKDEAFDKLIAERRSELFAEWGHRWFDLKRWDKSNEVLGALKGENWQPTDILFPIPLEEMKRNTLLNQNLGYN